MRLVFFYLIKDYTFSTFFIYLTEEKKNTISRENTIICMYHKNIDKMIVHLYKNDHVNACKIQRKQKSSAK